MCRRRSLTAFFILSCLLASQASKANDTFVHHSAGNLQFIKNYSVVICSERLEFGGDGAAHDIDENANQYGRVLVVRLAK